ncbi:MAG: hypothetical protein ACM3OB_03660 [Acidobacteriota bacterium]
MTRIPRTLAVSLAALAVVILGLAAPARAVPVFSRKYHTSCTTCHAIFPKLNPFGQAFRLNGYRMPGESENPDLVKDKPVSLGAEAYKQMWPAAVWPSDVPSHAPVAINVKMANLYVSSHDDSGHSIVHNDFQFPQEANLFAAGTLGDNFGFFSELTWSENPDGSTETEIEHAQLNVNSPFGAPHLVNFKIGKFAPDYADGFQEMWIMTDNGIDTLFSYDPIGLHGGTGTSEEPLGIGLPAGVKGIEMYGVANHRLFYTLGVVNGIGNGVNGTHDANSAKDFYGRIDYKFGGMGLDGDTTGVTVPAENWRERSMRVGAFGYRGDGSNVPFDLTDDAGGSFTVEDRTFDRYGLYLSWYFDDLNVFGVVMRGTDRLRVTDLGAGSISNIDPNYDAWFVQADYVIKPPIQASLRYEQLRPGDPAAPTQKVANANLSFLVRANIKAMLEYNRDLNDSQNYQLSTVLRFAF